MRPIWHRPTTGARARGALLALLSVVALATLPATPAAAAEIFSDGFESGNLSAWSVNTGGGGTAGAQTSIVHDGLFAARLTASTGDGSFAYARKTLPSARADLTVDGWFNLQAEGASRANVPLVRLYGADGSRFVSVYRQNLDSDRVYVQLNGAYQSTTGRLPLKTWAQVRVALTGAGTSAAALEVWINGTSVYRVAASLPSVLSVQIGNDTKKQAFSMVVDEVSFDDGSTSPPPPGDPVLVGAGDIADCNNPGDEATAALLDEIPGTVFTTGDNVYPTATLSQLENCYSSSWGRHKARTRPVVGNHEYDSSGNTGHFDYFGAAAGPAGKGYYSYDVGSWHVVVLNSNCAFVGGCQAGSAQEQWLRADLAASAADCTVAMMHHPRFSSGSSHGSNTAMAPFWQALYDAGAELVLAGHEHSYERFAPMTPSGVSDASFGLRSFVIGTGGFSHYPLGTPLPTSEARNSDTFGVVKLTLRDGSYDWQFVPEAGKTYTDLGTGTCHGKPGTTPPPPSDTDFSDGFESGDFGAWTSSTVRGDGSAVVQTSIVRGGTRAARLKATSSSGSAAYLRRSLSPTSDLTAGGWFNIQAEGSSGANVPILRMFTGSGTRILSLYRQNRSGDQLWIQHSGTYNRVAATLPLSTWAQLRVRVVVAGSSSTVEVFFGGTRVYQTTSASLGTSAVAAIQVGNDTSSQPFDIVVDDVSASPSG